MKRLLLFVATLALLAGCGGQPPANPEPAGGVAPEGGVEVTLKDLSFQPSEISVKAGTPITFVNRDNMEHDVMQVAVKEIHSTEPGFASPVLKPGESWSITLDEPGTYPILCKQGLHYTAGMVGTITVTP